jgi:hypothetical protein
MVNKDIVGGCDEDGDIDVDEMNCVDAVVDQDIRMRGLSLDLFAAFEDDEV